MKKPYSGFSLIEILVAVVLLGLIALFLARFSAIMHRNTAAAQDRQEATALANGIMDQIRTYARLRQEPPAKLNNVALTESNAGAKATGSVQGQRTNYVLTIQYADKNNNLAKPTWNSASPTLRFKAQVMLEWADAEGKMQYVLLAQDVYQPKQSEKLADPLPNDACDTVANWEDTKCYKQGSYRRHSDKLWICRSETGCPDKAVNSPEKKPLLWGYTGKDCNNAAPTVTGAPTDLIACTAAVGTPPGSSGNQDPNNPSNPQDPQNPDNPNNKPSGSYFITKIAIRVYASSGKTQCTLPKITEGSGSCVVPTGTDLSNLLPIADSITKASCQINNDSAKFEVTCSSTGSKKSATIKEAALKTDHPDTIKWMTFDLR
ncbi:prepilin-type N-terminal cleavage/methylation domain-containing protein [Chitinilyticum aquatile]|uniref:prepilin-type N-terminal cleavage/methylation domain-containing protein n=1 Tax=Chitinilyticum aquatile TaxID=362520 RepID=UPI0004140B83|nr:prepilin-type N-terminal cleavage/methylation domain-containing protein [Chitinilyticum aquatile]